MAGLVQRYVQEYWRSSYDVLVRPPGERSEVEAELDLLEPNALVTFRGGITRRQWENIRALPEVEVAAPIANLGVAWITREVAWTQLQPGIYRVYTVHRVDEGLRQQEWRHERYLYVSVAPAGAGADPGLGRRSDGGRSRAKGPRIRALAGLRRAALGPEGVRN